MQQFWVVGGEYKGTAFHEVVSGREEWIGPFEDYASAEQEWAKRAWTTFENGHAHYRIECVDPDEPPRCTD
jgi:hypothetical protein